MFYLAALQGPRVGGAQRAGAAAAPLPRVHLPGPERAAGPPRGEGRAGWTSNAPEAEAGSRKERAIVFRSCRRAECRWNVVSAQAPLEVGVLASLALVDKDHSKSWLRHVRSRPAAPADLRIS